MTPTNGVFSNNQNWLMWLYGELKKTHEVVLNGARADTDIILGMSESQMHNIVHSHQVYPKAQLILYNWDLHPTIRRGRNPDWVKFLAEADEIWTQTKYHADLCKKITGLEHIVMPMGAPLEEELGNKEIKYEPFVMMASREDVYKGWDLFKQGCRDLAIEGKCCHPHRYDREKYIDILSRCRVMVIASEEEANAPMSSYEAAYMNKPLLLSDIDANREEWGKCATYFKPNDLEDFKKKLQFVYDGKADKKIPLAKKRSEFFTVQAFADRINKRLNQKYG